MGQRLKALAKGLEKPKRLEILDNAIDDFSRFSQLHRPYSMTYILLYKMDEKMTISSIAQLTQLNRIMTYKYMTELEKRGFAAEFQEKVSRFSAVAYDDVSRRIISEYESELDADRRTCADMISLLSSQGNGKRIQTIELVQRFMSLGLTTNQSSAYTRLLLSKGRMKATDISKGTIPRVQAYEALRGLEELDLVRCDRSGAGKRSDAFLWEAVRIEEGLGSLMRRFDESIDESRKLSAKVKRELDSLSKDQILEFREARNTSRPSRSA